MDATAVIRDYLKTSPLVRLLGIEEVSLGDGRAELLLPFRDDLVTIGDNVHGGAIATLVDCATAAAAWAGAEMPERPVGTTIDLTLHYLRPATATDLRCVAEVTHRGRSLVRLRAAVYDGSGALVAEGLAAYKLG